MFVVAPVTRVVDPQDTTHVTNYWPVVFEYEDRGHAGEAIDQKPSRSAAQMLADALNKAITDNNK